MSDMQPSGDPAVTIRPSTRADLPALGRLGAMLVRTHHDFDGARFIPATPQTERGYEWYLGTQLDNADAIILVAEQEGEVIGYTYAAVEGFDWLMLRGPAGVINDILVDPARRAHGVGRMLFDAVVAALRDRGAPQAVLYTADGNAAAQRLFARAGFRRTMVEMTRELDG